MYLVYCRVSTQDQADNNATSLAEQERRGRALAVLKGAGAYDVSVYIDAGISGAEPFEDRPQGKKILLEMEENDTIIAVKMDRMFRSASDALMNAERFRKRQVDLILADLGTDPVTSNGPAKLFFGILAMVAEFERERIAERTADGRRAKRAKRGHLGGEAPYGYRVVGEGRESKLEEIPEEMATVTKLRQLMRECQPVNAFRMAGKMGLTCRSGQPFQIHQIQRIVKRFDQLEPLERVIYSEVA